jgi:predicted TIM-barrel fold metal-dependent hydrolase
MDVPINLHILSGFSYAKGARPRGIEQFRGSVELKVLDAIHVLFDFIFYGVLERFPRLKLVLVEFEIGWIPWILQQWDYYVQRFSASNPLPLSLSPSEYFTRQVFATFVDDGVGTSHFSRGWGIDNCLWSNDFPHGNTSWPESRRVIETTLADLDSPTRARLLHRNVAELYRLDLADPITTGGHLR